MLRLICLFCIVNDGFGDISLLRTMLIKRYGTDYIFTVDNLMTAGLLFEPIGENRWNKIINKFNLFPDQTDRYDLANVYNGYAPLLCRIVENALLCNYHKVYNREKDKLFWGFCDMKYNNKMSIISDDVFTVAQESNISNDNILIYVIGGITYSEIAALRSLKQINPNKQIVIATTKIINSSSIITSLI